MTMAVMQKVTKPRQHLAAACETGDVDSGLPLDLSVAHHVNADRVGVQPEPCAEPTAALLVLCPLTTATAGATRHACHRDDRGTVHFLGIAEDPPHRQRVSRAADVVEDGCGRVELLVCCHDRSPAVVGRPMCPS
jgi:hypothetical protein